MRYLKNRNKGKNTRKSYRINVYNYSRRYFIRYSKLIALYGVFSFDSSEGYSVYLDVRIPKYKPPYFKEYYHYKYYNKKFCKWIEKFKK